MSDCELWSIMSVYGSSERLKKTPLTPHTPLVGNRRPAETYSLYSPYSPSRSRGFTNEREQYPFPVRRHHLRRLALPGVRRLPIPRALDGWTEGRIARITPGSLLLVGSWLL